MRISAIAIVGLLAALPASAQVPGSTHPYGLDPYAPSDAMWLRTYGSALVAQTPLLELTTLDPYKPSEAALIRQIGGGIPVCCLDGFWPGLQLGPSTPTSLRGLALTPAIRFATQDARFIVRADSPQAAAANTAPAPAAQSGPTSAVTLARPLTNDGVSIRYGGQTWISAGRAVPLESSAFERLGESAGFPVYKRTGATDGVIYVPSRNNLIAPYRLKP